MTSKPHDSDLPKLLRLSDGAFVRQEVDNIGWVILGDHVAVVDALERPELEDEVFRLLAETTGGRPVRYVFNTHPHFDHVALNAAFERRCGARIIGAETQSIPATGLWFEGGGRRLLFLPLPGCHTAADCVAWLPEDGVLFVGDIFGWGLIPWDRPLTTQKKGEIVATYERLIAFAARHVVPGHGPCATTAELRRWLDYLETTCAAVKDACARGLSDDQVRNGAVPPPEDMCHWWRFCQWKHNDTLKKILHAVRNGRL